MTHLRSVQSEQFLYKVAFIAGSQEKGGRRFEAWVTGPDAIEIQKTCQREVAPMQISHFESIIRYTTPQFILIRMA